MDIWERQYFNEIIFTYAVDIYVMCDVILANNKNTQILVCNFYIYKIPK